MDKTLMSQSDVSIEMNEEDSNNLKRIFDTFDANKSGALNLNEFEALTKAIGLKFNAKDVNLLFSKLDVNKTDLIEFEEFLNSMSKYFAYPNLKLLLREFHRFDLNATGFITVDEIVQVLSQFRRVDPRYLDRNKIQEALRNSKIDVNGDGKISLEEFALNKQVFDEIFV